MIRVVYMIECYSRDGKLLIYRNYARNKKIAEKYARRLIGATFRKLTNDEMAFISLDDVETR